MGKRAQTVTVAALHKALAKIIAEGGARLPVCVDKPTISHPLESDGAVIIDIDGFRVESVPQIDDDGGTAVDSRGRERYRTCFVIHGWGYGRLADNWCDEKRDAYAEAALEASTEAAAIRARGNQ